MISKGNDRNQVNESGERAKEGLDKEEKPFAQTRRQLLVMLHLIGLRVLGKSFVSLCLLSKIRL